MTAGKFHRPFLFFKQKLVWLVPLLQLSTLSYCTDLILTILTFLTVFSVVIFITFLIMPQACEIKITYYICSQKLITDFGSSCSLSPLFLFSERCVHSSRNSLTCLISRWKPTESTALTFSWDFSAPCILFILTIKVWICIAVFLGLSSCPISKQRGFWNLHVPPFRFTSWCQQ